MAAGDIIIPDNTITPEIMQKIATEVTKLLNTNAKDPGQWEEVTSTNGVTSLPVLQAMGNTYKLVRVAISVLQGLNGREVELQMNADQTAIQWRYVGVAGSDLQPTEWITLIDVSLLAGAPGETPEFRQGGEGLEWKYQSEEDDAWRVLVSIDALKLQFSDLTAENIAEFWRGVPADVMAEFQRPATDAAADAREATAAAQNVADHPTYIGTDHYVYKYDLTAQEYVKTDIYVKGEGLDYNTMTPEEIAGITGKSAYEVAVENGFVGTEQEWLASLKGEKGDGSEQIQPDWNATEGKGAILNKPTIPDAYDDTAIRQKITDTLTDAKAYTDDQIAAIEVYTPYILDISSIYDGRAFSSEATDDFIAACGEAVSKQCTAASLPDTTFPCTIIDIGAGYIILFDLSANMDGDLQNSAYTVLINKDAKSVESYLHEQAAGLSEADKKKLDRIGSFLEVNTLSNLDPHFETIQMNAVQVNQSLTIADATDLPDITVVHLMVHSNLSVTITIPTTGKYISLCGSSHTFSAGKKYVEFSLKYVKGIWYIAKLEQQ